MTFEVAPATGFTGTGYDLIAMFDCLHDMGDPVGAARHVREAIAADGTWMVVEPMAGDRVEDNLNPVGRAYYGFSTLLCTPASLSQDVGLALGTQAGPAKIRDVSTAAGFTAFRTAATDAVQQRVRGPSVTRTSARRRLLGWARTRAGPRTRTSSASPSATGCGSPTRSTSQDHAHRRWCWCPPGRSCPSRFWKAQIGFLARHYRVITFDGRGSGRSGRPVGAAAYTDRQYADDIVAVLDATGTDAGRAGHGVVRGVLGGARRGRATRDRVLGHHRDRPVLRPGRAPRPAATTCRGTSRWTSTHGWAKYNKHYWLGGGYDDFSSSSSGRCSPSRTRPSRSRTASAGRTRSRRRRSRTRPPAGSAATARCASRSRRWPGR